MQQFHGNEGSSINLIDLIDRADVRVIQRRSGFGFPLKTVEGLWVGGKFFGQKLQCYMTAELQVFRLIDHAHAPTPDFLQYAVMRNGLSRGTERCVHGGMVGVPQNKVNSSGCLAFLDS